MYVWPREAHRGRDVRVAPGLGPATVGLLRPQIVVPRWAVDLPPDELELILAHEEEHVRHRDPLLLGLGLVTLIACPWNPFVWWQHRRLRDAVEVDCDRRVIRSGAASARYADLLVRIGSRRARRLALAPTLNGTMSLLERRLAAMKKTNLRAALPRTLAATALSLALLVVACTTEPPVASDGPGASAAVVQQERNQAVADVWVEPDGRVYINDVREPMERVSEALLALDAASEGRLVVSIAADPAVPYGVMETLQREIQASGAVRVSFEMTEARPGPTPLGDPAEVTRGLRIALPEQGRERQVSIRNILHLEVQPSGVVEVRRGDSSEAQRVRAADVERIWREDVTQNPNLIAAVKVHPDAGYARMVEVLDALHAAGAQRISIQQLPAGA